MEKLFQKINNTLTIAKSKHPIVTASFAIACASLFIIIILASLIVMIDKNMNFGNAMQLTFGFHTSTGGANHTDVYIYLIRLVAIISGTLLFSGTIISIMTNVMRGYITNRDGALGRLKISNHIIVLGYNKEVPAMIADFMFTSGRKTILVLSDKNKAQVLGDLNATLATMLEKPKNKVNLIVRKGDAGSLSELKDIGIENANGILIMNEHIGMGDKLCESDFLGSLHLVLKIANFNLKPHTPIGVETSTQEAAEVMRSLSKDIPGLNDKEIQFFAHHKKLGQFMALVVANPDMSNVLVDILDYSGSEFYPLNFNVSLEDYLKHYSEAIPCIDFNGRLYCLAEDEKNLHKKRLLPYETKRRLAPLETEPDKKPLFVYVIGESRKYKYFKEAISAERPNAVIQRFKTNDIDDYVATLAKNGDENSVAVILSDDTVSPANYDVNVFLTLIELSRAVGIRQRKFKVFSEIIDPNNKDSLERFNVQNFVISTKVISTLASKLLSDAHAEEFYEEIFSNTSDYMDICVTPANEVFNITEPETFTSYAEFIHAGYYGTYQSAKTIIPLGIVLPNGEHRFFCNEMDNQRQFVLEPATKIVYALLFKH